MEALILKINYSYQHRTQTICFVRQAAQIEDLGQPRLMVLTDFRNLSRQQEYQASQEDWY